MADANEWIVVGIEVSLASLFRLAVPRTRQAISIATPYAEAPNSARTNSMNRLSLGMGCLSRG